MICGAEDWVAIELFGKSKEAWFTEVLGLNHGIPSHDTFGKVFAIYKRNSSNLGCHGLSNPSSSRHKLVTGNSPAKLSSP